MAKDASFEKISSIEAHPNADNLEIATICGWKVVVRKNTFNVGDVVFYIREDAKLLEYDSYYNEKSKIKNEFGLIPENFDELYLKNNAKYPWQIPLLRYLGSNGHVKTVRLRGEYSSGIAISLNDIFAHINQEKSKNWEEDNVRLNSEFPGNFLIGKYGVTHWEAPIRNVGDLQVKGGLPYSIPKSDEENFQNLNEYEIPYGEEVLLTKKLDGISTTIIAFPDGRMHVCTRSNDLDMTCDNVWNRAAQPVLPLAKAWAEHYNRPIVLRGETCAPSMQKFSFNKDKDVPVPTFNLYGVIMLDEHDYAMKYGLWGTPYHFTEIAKQIKDITGKDIKTVPILGVEVLTKDLLDKYLNMPLEFGEGIVINTRRNHFKCKSLAYLEAISKH